MVCPGPVCRLAGCPAGPHWHGRFMGGRRAMGARGSMGKERAMPRGRHSPVYRCHFSRLPFFAAPKSHRLRRRAQTHTGCLRARATRVGSTVSRHPHRENRAPAKGFPADGPKHHPSHSISEKSRLEIDFFNLELLFQIF